MLLNRRKELRPQGGADSAALSVELADASKKYKSLKKKMRRVEDERNDKEDELQLVQTEYWDLKKSGKRKDAEVAELQSQNLNLGTELRAMRRELAAGSGGEGMAQVAGPVVAPAVAAATNAVVTKATQQPGAVHFSAEFAALDEDELSKMQSELSQLRRKVRQLEAMKESQFVPGSTSAIMTPTPGGSAAAPVALLPKKHKLTKDEEEKLEFVEDLGGIAKVRQLLERSDDRDIRETAREVLSALPKNAEAILVDRKAARAAPAAGAAGAASGGAAGAAAVGGGGQWQAVTCSVLLAAFQSSQLVSLLTGNNLLPHRLQRSAVRLRRWPRLGWRSWSRP